MFPDFQNQSRIDTRISRRSNLCIGDLLEVMPVDVDGFTVRGVPYDNSGGTDDIRDLDLTLYERVEFRRTDGSGEVFSLEVGTYVVIEDRRHHLVRVFIQHGNPSTVELMLFNGSKRKILRVECTVDTLMSFKFLRLANKRVLSGKAALTAVKKFYIDLK